MDWNWERVITKEWGQRIKEERRIQQIKEEEATSDDEENQKNEDDKIPVQKIP